jgi:NADPH-dependent 2,4-dienoyl-CoA reductase/sulfur reductase-like enzyme/nitrite reductase/ring-hydroxylating ferredoxin subunit
MLREIALAKIGDIAEGEMKAFAFGEKKILLSKVSGRFYAVGGICPHYGASLDEGILHGTRIVCPWHHASYDVRTGDVLEPPSLDALPRFEVKIDGEDVIVMVPDEIPERRTPSMAKHDPDEDKRTFVIIGAGAAGNAAAQTLREEGYRGRIIMITQEDSLPYDRPMLSKEFLEGQAEEEWIPLRSREFYEEHDIEVMFLKRVEELDASRKLITFQDGTTLTYDTVLVATGGVPNRLDIPGVDLENVFTLRSFDDSRRIIEASEKATRVAVIGASFIGMETAYSLSQRKLSVTVIAPDSVPFETTLGEEVGRLFQTLHEQNGVTFRLGATVRGFEGSGAVESVVLEDGEQIQADLVVVGVGVKPATGFLKGIELLSDGSLKVDQHFRVGDGIYAAGDIATFPYPYTGEPTRIEHWRTAEQQGRIAGRNMAGKIASYTGVPFFWTNQVGLYFRYVGCSKQWDEVIIDGDVSSQDFIAFYVKDGRVVAAAGNNREKEMASIEELMRANDMPSPEQLRRAPACLLGWPAEEAFLEETVLG